MALLIMSCLSLLAKMRKHKFSDFFHAELGKTIVQRLTNCKEKGLVEREIEMKKGMTCRHPLHGRVKCYFALAFTGSYVQNGSAAR